MSITLKPVLELDPYYYRNPEREYILSDFDYIQEQYWKDCLKDSGITGLEPYKSASWFVRLSDIDFENLQIIVHKHCENRSKKLLEKLDFIPLIGGYVFEYENIIIFPGCCIDLEIIFEWEIAAHCQNKDEQKYLWNGHPQLKYFSKDELIEITQTAEYGEPPQPEVFDVPRKDLILAVDEAKEELKQLTTKILPITQKILPNQYKKLANQLVWGKPDYQNLD
jgi:hypothetical protein